MDFTSSFFDTGLPVATSGLPFTTVNVGGGWPVPRTSMWISPWGPSPAYAGSTGFPPTPPPRWIRPSAVHSTKKGAPVEARPKVSPSDSGSQEAPRKNGHALITPEGTPPASSLAPCCPWRQRRTQKTLENVPKKDKTEATPNQRTTVASSGVMNGPIGNTVTGVSPTTELMVAGQTPAYPLFTVCPPTGYWVGTPAAGPCKKVSAPPRNQPDQPVLTWTLRRASPKLPISGKSFTPQRLPVWAREGSQVAHADASAPTSDFSPTVAPIQEPPITGRRQNSPAAASNSRSVRVAPTTPTLTFGASPGPPRLTCTPAQHNVVRQDCLPGTTALLTPDPPDPVGFSLEMLPLPCAYLRLPWPKKRRYCRLVPFPQSTWENACGKKAVDSVNQKIRRDNDSRQPCVSSSGAFPKPTQLHVLHAAHELLVRRMFVERHVSSPPCAYLIRYVYSPCVRRPLGPIMRPEEGGRPLLMEENGSLMDDTMARELFLRSQNAFSASQIFGFGFSAAGAFVRHIRSKTNRRTKCAEEDVCLIYFRLRLQDLPFSRRQLEQDWEHRRHEIRPNVSSVVIVFDFRFSDLERPPPNSTVKTTAAGTPSYVASFPATAGGSGLVRFEQGSRWSPDAMRRIVHLTAQTHSILDSWLINNLEGRELSILHLPPESFSLLVDAAVQKARMQRSVNVRSGVATSETSSSRDSDSDASSSSFCSDDDEADNVSRASSSTVSHASSKAPTVPPTAQSFFRPCFFSRLLNATPPPTRRTKDCVLRPLTTSKNKGPSKSHSKTCSDSVNSKGKHLSAQKQIVNIELTASVKCRQDGVFAPVRKTDASQPLPSPTTATYAAPATPSQRSAADSAPRLNNRETEDKKKIDTRPEDGSTRTTRTRVKHTAMIFQAPQKTKQALVSGKERRWLALHLLRAMRFHRPRRTASLKRRRVPPRLSSSPLPSSSCPLTLSKGVPEIQTQPPVEKEKSRDMLPISQPPRHALLKERQQATWFKKSRLNSTASFLNQPAEDPCEHLTAHECPRTASHPPFPTLMSFFESGSRRPPRRSRNSASLTSHSSSRTSLSQNRLETNPAEPYDYTASDYKTQKPYHPNGVDPFRLQGEHLRGGSFLNTPRAPPQRSFLSHLLNRKIFCGSCDNNAPPQLTKRYPTYSQPDNHISPMHMRRSKVMPYHDEDNVVPDLRRHRVSRKSAVYDEETLYSASPVDSTEDTRFRARQFSHTSMISRRSAPSDEQWEVTPSRRRITTHADRHTGPIIPRMRSLRHKESGHSMPFSPMHNTTIQSSNRAVHHDVNVNCAPTSSPVSRQKVLRSVGRSPPTRKLPPFRIDDSSRLSASESPDVTSLRRSAFTVPQKRRSNCWKPALKPSPSGSPIPQENVTHRTECTEISLLSLVSVSPHQTFPPSAVELLTEPGMPLHTVVPDRQFWGVESHESP